MAYTCIFPKCSKTCTDCNEAKPSHPNLDDLRRLREQALSAGAGSGAWIKAAQAMMDAFPSIYEKAQAMNMERRALRAAMTTVVNDWTAQFERNGHLAPKWVKEAREALEG